MKREIEVIVCNVEQYNEGFPPSDVTGFAEWLKVKIGSIPEECLMDAVLELSGGNGCDGDLVQVEILYARQETDEEEDERENAGARQEELIESRERAALARLKVKYEQ